MYICKKIKKADNESELKFKLVLDDLIEQEKMEAEYYNYNYMNNDFDEREDGSDEENNEDDLLMDTKKYYEKNAMDYLENDKNYYGNKIPIDEIFNSGNHYETFSTNNKDNFTTENYINKNNNDDYYDSNNKHLEYLTNNDAHEQNYVSSVIDQDLDDDGLGDDNEVYISNN